MITPLPPYPAALVRSQNARIMVIADLHIGWEIALSKEGIHVPTQTPKLLTKLKDLLSTYKPQRLLILGDVKHTVATAEKTEWRDVPDFFIELRKLVSEISVMRGNHDGNLEPLLPEMVNMLPATGVVFNDVGFFHGHRWPSPNLLKCKTLVMGHVHPVVAFRDPAGFRVTRQVWIKAVCNPTSLTRVLLQKNKIKVEENPEKALYAHFRIKPKTSQLFIIPSFNDFLGGRPLNERKPSHKINADMIAGPVLRSESVDMKNAETYLLDGTYLGTLEQLKMLS
jgi:putative SbcD/Mre11-related phosphoesterase